jgi:hypothetical protein
MGDNEPGNLLYVIAIDKQLTDPQMRYVLDLSGNISLDASNNITGTLNKMYEIQNNDSVSNVSSTQTAPITVNADRIIILSTNSSSKNEDLNGYVVNSSIKITYDISGASLKIEAVDGVNTPFTQTNVVDLIYKGLSTEINQDKLDELNLRLNQLRSDIAKYYGSKSGGGKPLDTQYGGNDDYKITERQKTAFNNIITSYIKAVNELLNIPMFKKLLSLTPSEVGAVLPKNKQDNLTKELKSVINVDVDFSKFEDNTKENKQIRNLLAGVDVNKGNIESFKAFLSANNIKLENDQNITLSDFANRFLYQIQKANYDYQTLSNTINTIPEFMEFVVDIVSKQTTQLGTFIGGQFLPTISNTQEVQKAINKAVRAKMKTNILTFLKIRNDDGDIYNRRFDIQLNSIGVPKIMQLKYNDDNLPYYREDSGILVPTDKAQDSGILVPTDKAQDSGNLVPTDKAQDSGILVPTDEALDKYTADGNIDMKIKTTYDREYLFGEFTQIFPPKMSNADIAKQMNIITEQLTAPDPKPVFILGYGASGAGKTSSLIYFNKGNTPDEQNGILIQLCNQLGASGKYDHIDVEYREMYNSGNDKNFTENPVYTDCSAVSFRHNKTDGFTLMKEYTHQNHHTYRISKELGNDCENSSNKTTKFDAGTPIGEIMIHLIDKDRHVKATTNNPNSSRSHSLIFVKLSKAGDSPIKQAYLIVGDFAGVENVFDCENPAVLTEFMNIKEDKVGSNRLFYEVEKCGDELDPIGSTASSCQNKNGGGGGEYNASGGNPSDPSTSLPIYDFENPALTEEFKQKYPILKSFSGKDYLKKAISFVRTSVGITKAKDIKLVEDINTLNMFYTEGENGTATKNDKFNNYKTLYEGLAQKITDVNSAIENSGIVKFRNQNRELAAKQTSYNDLMAKLDNAYTTPNKEPYLFKSIMMGDIKKINFTTDEVSKITEYIKSLPEGNPGILSKSISYQSFYSNLKTLFPRPGEASGFEDIKKKICSAFEIYKDYASSLISLINNTFGQKSYALPNECNANNLYDKKVPELNDELETILDIIFDEKLDFYNFVKKIDYDRTTRLALSKKVCANRRTEGTFINDSLKQVRNVIREMLTVKNAEALEMVPNYIDICFDQYCPTHENCFSFNSPKSQPASDIPSVIFTQIYEYLKKDINAYTKETMYKDLLVCVFCVFNISKKANNPPPVPYVDVNKLKCVVYNYDIFDEEHAKTFVEHAKTLINAIENKYKYTTESGSEKNRLEALKTVPIGVVENNSRAFRSLKDNDGKFLSSKNAYELFVFLKTQFEYRPGRASDNLSEPQNQESIGGGGLLEKLIELDKKRLEILKEFATNRRKYNEVSDVRGYNVLKTNFDNLFSLDSSELSYKDMADKIKTEINKLLQNDGKRLSINKKYSISENSSNANTIEMINSELAELDNLYKTAVNKTNVISNITSNIVAEGLTPTVVEQVKPVNNQIIANNLVTMQTPNMKPIIKEYLIDFIEAVDNSNAVSAVGTIEFIDRLSKLNTVATICNAEESTLTPFTNKLAMKDVLYTNFPTNLVVDEKKTGGTRRAAKRVAKRTKKRRPVSI